MGAQRVRDLVLFMKKLAQAVGLCAALALGSTKEVESVVGEAMQSVLQGTPVDEALEQAQEMAQMQLGM